MVCTFEQTEYTYEQTPDGIRVVVRRYVDASGESVWDVLTDTEQWPEWGPSVTAVRSADQRIEAGSCGEVQVLRTLWLPFEVQSCENGRWTWDVAGVAATGHFVERRADGAVVGFEIPPVAVGYVPVCVRACARIDALASPERESP